MSVIPPSKSDFVGGDAQSKEQAFTDKHNATGVLLGRSCHLSNQASSSTPQALKSQVRSRVTSREYFSRKKKVAQAWSNQVVDSLSIEEQVGQILFYSLSTNHDPRERELVEEYIHSYGIGGVRCKQEHPKKRLAWVNHFQSLSKYPLLIGEDVRWTFDDHFSLYGQRPEEDYFLWGKSIAEYFKYMGVHFAFIPLQGREESQSYEDKNVLSLSDKRAWLFIKGLQDSSIGVVLRQFLNNSRKKISGPKLPLYGHFASKVKQSDRSFVRMVFESGMSYVVCRDVQADSYMDSQGIVFCDVAEKNMHDLRGLDFEKAIVQAFKNGVDGFLLSHTSMPIVHKALVKGVLEGEIPKELLSYRVKKFLLAKEWAGLHEKRGIDENSIPQDKLAKGYLQSLEAKI